MVQFKEKVAETVKLPNFLQTPTFANQKEAIDIIWSILDLYFTGCKNWFLTNDEVSATCDDIDDLSLVLADLIPSKMYLRCWLWIGETINKWISFAIEDELFEAATNLRKLLNQEYD